MFNAARDNMKRTIGRWPPKEQPKLETKRLKQNA
jgi:hypothetical protein